MPVSLCLSAMFKKKPQIKPAAPLRSSDRRKLADQIIVDYHLNAPQPAEPAPEQKTEAATAHTALRNSLLPDNVQAARFTTTHGPDLKKVSGTVYIGAPAGEEARILWWSVNDRLYPSVYTLWRHPDMTPLLHTPGIVVKKLQGGADLMTPGLAGGPPFPAQAVKGAVTAIASTEAPSVPVAVGVCEIDVAALGKVQGERGKAVENLHWYGDELWSYSPNERPGKQAPEEIEGWRKTLEERWLVEKLGEVTVEDGEEEGGVDLNGGANDAHDGEHTNGNDMDTNDDTTRTAATRLSQQDIDSAFRNAFLFGVHHFKTTHSSAPNFGLTFPLTQSYVMSNLIQPFLPIFTAEDKEQLQMKKTSYKNIKKFVKSLDKEMILKSKEQNGNETVIMDIDFEDSNVADFKPYRLPKKETTGGTSQGRGDAATGTIDTGDDAVGQTLKITTYYKPTVKLQPLFSSASGKLLFTPPEVRELVATYIDTEQLVSATNKRLVKLNPTLSNAVFDGSGNLDKEVLAKGAVPRDALIERVLSAMSTSYAIVRNGVDPASVKTKSGTPPKVHITLETRSGNKTVTKVSGLEVYHINPRPLADELRKVCAGATSVEPLAGATKKNEKEIMEIMVQGPQKDAVVKALEKRGVQARWVEVLDKTKGKKR
jgi:translation initiation factor 2D